jgi:cytosine/adenosine deaminase-related metal-dependent hydrolase
MMLRASVVLQGARIVHHNRIAAEPIAFDAGRVVAVAPDDAFRLDMRDHLIFPGLINAHDHLQLNNIPRLPHAEPFPNSYAWIAAFAPHFQNPGVAAAIDVPSAERHWHGGLKNLLGGATTVAHHDPWHATLDDPTFPVGLLRAFGWSHSLGLGVERSGSGDSSDNNFPTAVDHLPRYGPPVRASFAATPAWHPWIIHLAEGADAVAAAELTQLDALGCLAANTVLVHGAGLTARDIDRIIECGAAVVWCPSSNLGMLGHTLDPRQLYAARRLALGSDSRLTGARDLLDELRVAAMHSGLAPRELLRLVTADASRVLRLPDVGSLAPGQHADCLIVRQKFDDPHYAIIDLTRSAIRAVVRSGAPQIADPDFADWFAHCGIEALPVRLDGRPKLLARQLARPEIIALEPGLDIV